jgi:hypothetical protein
MGANPAFAQFAVWVCSRPLSGAGGASDIFISIPKDIELYHHYMRGAEMGSLRTHISKPFIDVAADGSFLYEPPVNREVYPIIYFLQ